MAILKKGWLLFSIINKYFMDIKSSTLEKGLEIAKDFINKLIIPSIEETGLLMKDQITMLRFKNQIKILNRAKEYCEKYNIEPKKISLKILVPFLDYSGLEDDADLQEKWSILLSNLIDSEQNITNHVFPYILSQLSRDEFFPLEKVYHNKVLRYEELMLKYKTYKKEKDVERTQAALKIKEFNEILERDNNQNNDRIWSLEFKIIEYENRLKNINLEERYFLNNILEPEKVLMGLFKDFELSNLIRLGLIKEIREFYVPKQNLEIPERQEYNYTFHNVDLEIDLKSTTEYILTELGELFFKCCKEKSKK